MRTSNTLNIILLRHILVSAYCEAIHVVKLNFVSLRESFVSLCGHYFMRILGLKFYAIVILLFACQLSLFSQGNRNPNLSNKLLNELLNDSTPKALNTMPSETVYVPPVGARYTEIRSVDPANPPEIIDIAGNLNNKKEFKLSDIASSVRYVQLQQPTDAKITSILEVVSDDEHLFIKTWQGIFCYSTDGLYLYTLTLDNIKEDPSDAPNSVVSIVDHPVSGVLGNIDLLNGKLIYRTFTWPMDGDREVSLNIVEVKELDAQMRFNFQTGEFEKQVQPIYQRRLVHSKEGGEVRYIMMNDQSFFSNKLTTVTISGDTLCKFNKYQQPTIPRPNVGFSLHTYRINGQVRLQHSYNDTIFQVIPPNRFIPVYVMNWGSYKPDINQYAAGSDLEGKLVLKEDYVKPSGWIETPRYIFIHYTEGRYSYNGMDQGKVKFYWAIYDKAKKTLTHHHTSSTPPTAEIKSGSSSYKVTFSPMLENDIEPFGMPFWPMGVIHTGEMYMTFTKEQVKRFISTGRFKNDKLKVISDNMPEDGFCLMVVK